MGENVKRYRTRPMGVEAAQLIDTRQLEPVLAWIISRGGAAKLVGFTENAPTGIEINNGSIHADVGRRDWIVWDLKTQRFNVLTPAEFEAKYEEVANA